MRKKKLPTTVEVHQAIFEHLLEGFLTAVIKENKSRDVDMIVEANLMAFFGGSLL